MDHRNNPTVWAIRGIGLLIALVAAIIFVGPYFLVKAHNLASAQEKAKTEAAEAAKPGEPTVIMVPLFSAPDTGAKP